MPRHNNLAEPQMKRIALLRKNALFVAPPRGGETVAIPSTFTGTFRRHEINPQAYLTQLLVNLPDTPVTRPHAGRRSRSCRPSPTTRRRAS